MIYLVQMDRTARLCGLPLQLHTFGTVSSLSQRTLTFHYEDTVEFTFRLTSCAKYATDRIGETAYRTPFPHLIVKEPGVTHTFSVEDSREALVFSYRANQVQLLRKMELLPPTPIQQFGLSAPVQSLIREIMDYIPRSQEYTIADRIDLACLRLLEEMLFQRCAPQLDSSTERILQVASYLQVNFAEDIDLVSLAGRYGFSRRTFFRQWSAHFAATPRQYLLELKMEEAKRLLRESDLEVGAISTVLNFDEPSYFSAVFKKYAAQTPLQYRIRANSGEHSI